jgi:hypothetical protein
MVVVACRAQRAPDYAHSMVGGRPNGSTEIVIRYAFFDWWRIFNAGRRSKPAKPPLAFGPVRRDGLGKDWPGETKNV